jgi:UDP-N-acetylglucosamine--N-acetylmuramyl-(pentapeptide) pyrophosphoryl-undecaprenol N-acetylglucosamine transferase
MSLESNRPIVFIGSVGGHLADLYSVAQFITSEKKAFLTFSRPKREGLHNHYYMLDPRTSLIRMLLNGLQSAILFVRLRPKFVISSGAGFSIPFVVLSYIIGIKVVHFELACQVELPSKTGNFFRKLGIECFCQNHSLKGYGFKFIYDPFLSFEKYRTPSITPRKIFIAIGNTPQDFSRILGYVENIHQLFPMAKIIGQFGSTKIPNWPFLEGYDYLSRENFSDFLVGSDCVIVHGGVGVITECLEAGIVPIIIPRVVKLGEHLDETQVPLAYRIQSLDIGVTLSDNLDSSRIKSIIDEVCSNRIRRINKDSFGSKFINIINERLKGKL